VETGHRQLVQLLVDHGGGRTRRYGSHRRAFLRIPGVGTRLSPAEGVRNASSSAILGGRPRWRCDMAIYEFECQGCAERFEVNSSMSEHDHLKEEPPACPKCQSTDTRQLVSIFGCKTPTG
jgi:putative FmdB family regulatory protein